MKTHMQEVQTSRRRRCINKKCSKEDMCTMVSCYRKGNILHLLYGVAVVKSVSSQKGKSMTWHATSGTSLSQKKTKQVDLKRNSLYTCIKNINKKERWQRSQSISKRKGRRQSMMQPSQTIVISITYLCLRVVCCCHFAFYNIKG